MNRILLSLLLSAGLGGTALANVLLPPTQHEVMSRAWRTSGRPKDLSRTHIKVSKVHPESVIEIERQQRSTAVKVPATIKDEAQLKALALEATRWQPRIKQTTANESSHDPHDIELEQESEQLRPDTRYRVKVTTRDGQVSQSHGHVMQGLTSRTVTDFDPVHDAEMTITLAGTNMKPARAWMETQNLYVTAPHVNDEMLARGRKLMAEATSIGERIDMLNSNYQTLAPQLQSTDPAKLAEMDTERNTLTQRREELTAEGNRLLTEGGRSTSHIVSVGGLPVSAKIIANNVRLSAERKGQSNHHGLKQVETSEDSGYLHEEIEALTHDKIRLGVHFTAANPSTHEITFRAPQDDQTPAFTYEGRKYYRVVVESSTHHDQDPAR